jgi:hypothetical protein
VKANGTVRDSLSGFARNEGDDNVRVPDGGDATK